MYSSVTYTCVNRKWVIGDGDCVLVCMPARVLSSASSAPQVDTPTRAHVVVDQSSVRERARDRRIRQLQPLLHLENGRDAWSSRSGRTQWQGTTARWVTGRNVRAKTRTRAVSSRCCDETRGAPAIAIGLEVARRFLQAGTRVCIGFLTVPGCRSRLVGALQLGANLGANLLGSWWTQRDRSGASRPVSRSNRPSAHPVGPVFEAYGSEGWEFESLRVRSRSLAHKGPAGHSSRRAAGEPDWLRSSPLLPPEVKSITPCPR